MIKKNINRASAYAIQYALYSLCYVMKTAFNVICDAALPISAFMLFFFYVGESGLWETSAVECCRPAAVLGRVLVFNERLCRRWRLSTISCVFGIVPFSQRLRVTSVTKKFYRSNLIFVLDICSYFNIMASKTSKT